jgi:hypothetical protein
MEIGFQLKTVSIFFILSIMVISVFSQPRVVIMTDFPPVDVIPGGMGFGSAEKRSDPDDVQSMIRFLLYTNDFDVEGLIATSATFANIANKQHIFDMLYLYDHVDENLRSHDNRYPTADELRTKTWQGRSGTWGQPVSKIIGVDKDSEASEKIIRLLEKDDERPLWFCIWGGPSDLAQALWKISKTHDASETQHLFRKVRIYMIGFQDGSAKWLLDTFPNLFVIVSEKNYMGMFNNASGSNHSLSDLHWINKHIRKGHGLLGALYPESGFYPETPGVWEGDSPSFLYLASAVRGLNDPENPNQESWGGKFTQPDLTKNHWYDHPDGSITVSKWRSAVQDDFANRADWMLP